MATANLGYQSFYQAQLTAGISDTDLTIPVDVVPTPSEGFLVLESTSANKREIIYYTSKTSVSVVCPAGGRGYDGTTAQTHLQNSAVIMAPVAAMFEAMRDLFETTPQGWTPVTQTVSSVSYSGNRSYTLTMSADVSATLSPGMRVRTTRTVAAPTQCTSLNGTTQYWDKSSPSGMTWTDDFAVGRWIYLTSYALAAIDSRYNGTSGWEFGVAATGQLFLTGYNAGAANFSQVVSYQSVPLNKWVFVSAQLDMSAFTATSTTSYTMFDGADVPASVARGGTNPTALVQAGNYQIGASNSIRFFPGRLGPGGPYSAKVTQATFRATASQALSGSETSIAAAINFNGNATDASANSNTPSAVASATATNANSPFAGSSFNTPTGTTDFAIVTSVVTTTVVAQVPEGNTIPTSGGVSAMSYSTQKAPYGMPVDAGKWRVNFLWRVLSTNASNATFAAVTGMNYVVPIGAWNVGYFLGIYNVTTTAVYWNLSDTSQTGLTATGATTDTTLQTHIQATAAATMIANVYVSRAASLAAATTFTMYGLGATTSAGLTGNSSRCEFFAEFALI